MLMTKVPGSYSQSGQESFVLAALQNKANGFFVEIGAFHSRELSNTFVLENSFGWKGIAFEIEKKRYKEYKANRMNPCVLSDATKVDYHECFKTFGVPKVIDYLQVDIEPAHQSLAALKLMPFSDYIFRVITFEHDLYANSENIQVQVEANQILRSFGYTRVAKNVKNGGMSYEDWYVHENSIDFEIFDLILPSDTEWVDFFEK